MSRAAPDVGQGVLGGWREEDWAVATRLSNLAQLLGPSTHVTAAIHVHRCTGAGALLLVCPWDFRPLKSHWLTG